MIALIGTIFLASVFGSLHCAGMCGAFLMLAVGGAEPGVSRGRKFVLQASYHLGRLATYVMLGAIAGAIGSMVNMGGAMVGVGRAAAVVAGAMMVAFGAITLLRIAGVKAKLAHAPMFMQKLVAAGHKASEKLSPAQRAAAIGLMTTLLPCGWLWAFVITAAGTGSAAWGAAAMAAFWVGTLPVLVGLGISLQRIGPVVSRRLPMVTALAVIAVGSYTIYSRAGIPLSGAMEKKETASLSAEVKAVDQSKLPCCVKDEAQR